MVHMSTLVATHVAINALSVFTLYDISGVFNRKITRRTFCMIEVTFLRKFRESYNSILLV